LRQSAAVNADDACRRGDADMVVNLSVAKKLTNMRTTGSDENTFIRPPRQMTLEQALEYTEDDELVEVTPAAVRLRKMGLTENQHKRSSKKVAATE
jgi:GTP-binding protein